VIRLLSDFLPQKLGGALRRPFLLPGKAAHHVARISVVRRTVREDTPPYGQWTGGMTVAASCGRSLRHWETRGQ
jgi:hypothetical protein